MREYLLTFAQDPRFASSTGRESEPIKAVLATLDRSFLTNGMLPFYAVDLNDAVGFQFASVFTRSLDPAVAEKEVRDSFPARLGSVFSADDWESILSALSSEAQAFKGRKETIAIADWERFLQTGTPPFKTDLTPEEAVRESPGLSGWALFPLFFIPITAFVFVVLRVRSQQGSSPRASSGKAGGEPSWKKDPFLLEFESAFLRVQEGWNQGNLSGVARFLSDGVRDRFEVAIRLNALQGFRNVSEGMAVESLEVVPIGSAKQGSFERKVVRVRARAAETTVELKTGKVTKRSSAESFEELWGMIRTGNQAPDALGLDAPCPSCGAIVPTQTDSSNCPSCRVLLNSGSHGWVLAEITQSSESLRSLDPPSLKGLVAIQQKDPLFETQYLEDRASALLYRIFEARSRCRPELLGPFVLPELLARKRGGLAKPHPKGPYSQLAVGSAQVVSVVLGESSASEALDRVGVELHWNAHEREAEPALLEFVRSSASKTATRKPLMSFHCPGCGAPESEERDRPQCAHCGTSLNDVRGEWTLASFRLGDSTDLPEMQQS